jgi:hypothetical protein
VSTSSDELFEPSSKQPRGLTEALEALDGTRCTFCHELFTPEELDDPDATYIEVSSWVTGPKLQSPVLRSHTGKRAHKDCVLKQIDGEAPDQEPLEGFE